MTGGGSGLRWRLVLERNRRPRDRGIGYTYLWGGCEPPPEWEAIVLIVGSGATPAQPSYFSELREPASIRSVEAASSLAEVRKLLDAGFELLEYVCEGSLDAARVAYVPRPPWPMPPWVWLREPARSLRFEAGRGSLGEKLEPHHKRRNDRAGRAWRWYEVYRERQGEGWYVEAEWGRGAARGAKIYRGTAGVNVGNVWARHVLKLGYELVQVRMDAQYDDEVLDLTLAFPKWPLPTSIDLNLPWVPATLKRVVAGEN